MRVFDAPELTLLLKGEPMAATKTPGTNTGKQGGIFQEIGPRGGSRPNYTTVPDNRPLPSASTWQERRLSGGGEA